MPRDGSGRAHNEVEGDEIVHGAGDNDVGNLYSLLKQCYANITCKSVASSGVDRSGKAVPPPELEKGEALEGMGASGGGDKTEGSGKGPIKSIVDKEAEKAK